MTVGNLLCTGKGRSKKEAKRKAAEAMLNTISKTNLSMEPPNKKMAFVPAGSGPPAPISFLPAGNLWRWWDRVVWKWTLSKGITLLLRDIFTLAEFEGYSLVTVHSAYTVSLQSRVDISCSMSWIAHFVKRNRHFPSLLINPSWYFLFWAKLVSSRFVVLPLVFFYVVYRLSQ